MSTTFDGKRQRLKQKELVFRVLRMFSEELQRIHASSIWDISLSSSQIIENLKRQYDIDYKTEYWLWMQLKKYEEDTNTKLFVKSNSSSGGFTLRLSYPYKDFHQKKHLYISEKLMVANGVFDMLCEYGKTKEDGVVRMFLGAGGLGSHLATLIAEKSNQFPFLLELYSHNLGVIEQLSKDMENVRLLVPGGSVDPITYTILGDDIAEFSSVHFDLIIQGTSFVYQGKLYIESEQEFGRKQAIARCDSSLRILTLSLHELTEDEKLVEHLQSYASLADYDQLIVPRSSFVRDLNLPTQRLFATYAPMLEPLVLNWSYGIYRILK